MGEYDGGDDCLFVVSLEEIVCHPWLMSLESVVMLDGDGVDGASDP